VTLSGDTNEEGITVPVSATVSILVYTAGLYTLADGVDGIETCCITSHIVLAGSMVY
jgi:hypothetical protein